MDAMGTQKEIAKKIGRKKGFYVLALKGNQSTLHEDIKLYFSEEKHLKDCEYIENKQKARGVIEKREYWQTNDIKWISQKKEWYGLKSIIMTKNTIIKNGETQEDIRYYISNLPLDIYDVSRAIRGHWIVESYHWHLDVTFREDANRTIDKMAAYNLNIVRKICLNILKLLDVGKKISLRRKRYWITMRPDRFLVQVLDI